MTNSVEFNPQAKAQTKVEKMSVDQAMPILWGVLGEVYNVGSNDMEIPQLLSLIEKCQNGKIEPEEAIRIAKGIQSNKQDYH